jgi:serine/threonine-protein kinase RsbW
MADVPGTVVPRCGAFTRLGHAERVITLPLEAPARDARLPVSEIARDLHLPASAPKTRVRRALARLGTHGGSVTRVLGLLASSPPGDGYRDAERVPPGLRLGCLPLPMGPGADPADACGWRAFPGDPAELRTLRRWIEDLLLPGPTRDDVIEVACELAGNAICHTRSGQGGKFEVRVERTPGLVSVTVADNGGGCEPRLVADPLGEHGRGLRIVHALSAQVTVTGGKQGRQVRADVPAAEK